MKKFLLISLIFFSLNAFAGYNDQSSSINDGSDIILINNDGSLNITVSVTATLATGATVKLSDGTDNLLIDSSGNIGVNVQGTPTVIISGTPSVTVSSGNITATVSGTPTVSISGTVTTSGTSTVTGTVTASLASGSIIKVTDGTDNLDITSSGYLTTQLIDDYGFSPEFTPMDEMRIAPVIKMVGSPFSGTIIDTFFWTPSTAGDGTVTQANGEITIASGTGANTISLTSFQSARYIAGSSNRYRSQTRLSTGLTLGNTRRWGVRFSTTDGAYFGVDGTDMFIATLKNGVETQVRSASWNGSATTPTLTSNTSYEIYYTTGKVYFAIGGLLAHTVNANTSSWTAMYGFKAFAESVNTTNTSNVTIIQRVVSIAHLGYLETLPRYFHGTTAASTQLKRNAGVLHSIIINNTGGTLITCYDSASSATDTMILSIDAPTNADPVTLDYHLPFSNGLYCITTGTWDFTLTYESIIPVKTNLSYFALLLLLFLFILIFRKKLARLASKPGSPC